MHAPASRRRRAIIPAIGNRITPRRTRHSRHRGSAAASAAAAERRPEEHRHPAEHAAGDASRLPPLDDRRGRQCGEGKDRQRVHHQEIARARRRTASCPRRAISTVIASRATTIATIQPAPTQPSRRCSAQRPAGGQRGLRDVERDPAHEDDRMDVDHRRRARSSIAPLPAAAKTRRRRPPPSRTPMIRKNRSSARDRTRPP